MSRRVHLGPDRPSIIFVLIGLPIASAVLVGAIVYFFCLRH